MAPTTEYTVRLDAFEGPLDLLLFLIRRAEVEITDIPIAQITDQYLKFIGDLDDTEGSGGGGRLDIERAGEFLVMAATLVEIKSRTLAPPTPLPHGEADGLTEGSDAAAKKDKPPLDPRAELVHQLLEYKRFRDAGDRLSKYKHDWENMFPAGRALSGKEQVEQVPQAPEDITGPVDIDDIELIDLVEAFSRIIETVDLSRVGEHRVVMDDTPVEIHAEDIVDRLRRQASEALAAGTPDAPAEIEFAKVFEHRTRSEMIGLFLAVLELVKQQRIWVRQESGDLVGKRIVLRLAEEAGAQSAPTSDAAPSATSPDDASSA